MKVVRKTFLKLRNNFLFIPLFLVLDGVHLIFSSWIFFNFQIRLVDKLSGLSILASEIINDAEIGNVSQSSLFKITSGLNGALFIVLNMMFFLLIAWIFFRGILFLFAKKSFKNWWKFLLGSFGGFSFVFIISSLFFKVQIWNRQMGDFLARWFIWTFFLILLFFALFFMFWFVVEKKWYDAFFRYVIVLFAYIFSIWFMFMVGQPWSVIVFILFLPIISYFRYFSIS